MRRGQTYHMMTIAMRVLGGMKDEGWTMDNE